MKSWISSAFDVDASTKSNNVGKTIPTSKQKTFTSKETHFKNEFINDSDMSAAKQPISSKSITTSKNKENCLFSNSGSKGSEKLKKETISLSQRYEPQAKSDLVVNKSKIDQLNKILDDILAKNKGSIIIIEGPSGCGKYSTLKILCEEKKIELVTWQSTSLKINNFNSDLTNCEDNKEMYYSAPNEQYESQMSLFRQYLFKSSRYMSNQIFNENNNYINKTGNDEEKNHKKLLLIKEIPNFFYHNNESTKFHDLLREFLKFSKSSLVFIYTNSISSSSSNDSNSYFKLFPSDLRKELRIIECSFNSMANSYMTKHLERICKMESFNFADKEFLNNLVLSSNGDLRHALNQLELISAQFRSSSNFNPNSALIKNEKVKRTAVGTKKTITKLEKQSFETGIKDQSYGIFRGLGKVLYRKNMSLLNDSKSKKSDVNQKEIIKFIEIEKKLPKHMKKYYRDPLLNQPEDIMSKIPMSSDSITLYLHQNYLELFSIKSQGLPFDDTFESLESINNGLIHSDQISSMSFHYEIGNGQDNRLKDLSALITIRSILFNFNFNCDNNNDSDDEKSKTSRGSGNKSIWMPLYKPFTYKMIEMKNKRKKIAKQILIEETNQNVISNVDLNKEFFTTRLPYMVIKSKINSTKMKNKMPPSNGGVQEINKLDTIMLFSKFKPSNSKASFDQLVESSTVDDDDFKNIKNTELDIELLTMKSSTNNQKNEQSAAILSNYVYENNSEIDENFNF